MKKTVIAVAALLAMSMWVFAAAQPPEVKKFDTPMGTVTFPHATHVKAGIKCTQCHHTMKEGEAVQPCSSCHDAKEAKGNAPKLKDAVHKLCWECHKKMAAESKKTGPVQKDCKLCHVKA